MNFRILSAVFCSLLISGTLFAAVAVDFSKDSLIHYPLPNHPEDRIRIGKSEIPGKGKTGVSLSWETEHYHYTQTGILRNPLPEFQKFRKMELMLNVFVEPGSRVSQFGLRFRDAEGEIFQISSERLTSGRDGNQRIALLFDAENFLRPGERNRTGKSTGRCDCSA